MDHPDQVAGYVARTVLGEATTPESLAAGAWSTAYALTIAGRAMVLRVSRYGGDFAKDEAVSAVVDGSRSFRHRWRRWPGPCKPATGSGGSKPSAAVRMWRSG
jgi:hypothetical protein